MSRGNGGSGKVHSYLNRDENHRTRFRSHSLDSVERLEDGDQAGYRYAKSTFRTKKELRLLCELTAGKARHWADAPDSNPCKGLGNPYCW